LRVSRGVCVCVCDNECGKQTHTQTESAGRHIHAMQAGNPGTQVRILQHLAHLYTCMHVCPCPTHARCYPSCSRCITHTRMHAAGCHWLPRHMCTHAYACMSTHAKERGGKGGQRSRHSLDAPVALEYLPATHRVHVAADDEDDPRVPYLPAAHAEPEHVADPSAAYLPATQSVHSEAPAV